MNNNIIPVFYHIPKNSGTYVYNAILAEVKKVFNKKSIKVIRLVDKKFPLAKIIISDNNNFLSDAKITPVNNFNFNFDINHLDDSFIKKLPMVAIIINGRGLRCIKTSLEPLLKNAREVGSHEFIILREPFSREQSLYHYLTSDASKRELSHGRFKSRSFEEHIMSHQLQDSWLIRSLADIPNAEKLAEHHFDHACRVLSNFNIYDSKDTKKALEDAFLTCFGRNFVQEAPIFNNANSYKKVSLEDLPLNVQNEFNEKKFWDKKLYNYFLKNTFQTY